MRDNVRPNARGVVDDAGKYDQRVVPAGAASASSLSHKRDVNVHGLFAPLDRSTTRLGGATRRGLARSRSCGWLPRLRLRGRRPCGLRAAPVCIAADVPDGLLRTSKQSGRKTPRRSGHSQTLKLEHFWSVGTGWVNEHPKAASRLPTTHGGPRARPRGPDRVRERQRHHRERRPPRPGSGIKGALAHRARFHCSPGPGAQWRSRRRRHARQGLAQIRAHEDEASEALSALGAINENEAALARSTSTTCT